MSAYFITARAVGMVKIGCAYDPFDRLKTLQVRLAQQAQA